MGYVAGWQGVRFTTILRAGENSNFYVPINATTNGYGTIDYTNRKIGNNTSSLMTISRLIRIDVN